MPCIQHAISLQLKSPSTIGPLTIPRCTGMKPLAISMGDPAGIGPEIILRSLQLRPNLNPVIFGDFQVLMQTHQALIDADSQYAQTAKSLPPLEFARFEPSRNIQQTQKAMLCETSKLAAPIQPGTINAAYGQAAAAAITAATQSVLNQTTRALVTAPIHKEALAAAGVPYPGHTEMLAALAGHPPVRMMLANPELRTVLVTIHVSMRDAIDAITIANVLQTIEIAHRSLMQFGIERPRIAVAGLNPHAGEGGLFGREEIECIAPAIRKAQAQGIKVSGPYPGDTIFARARGCAEFDVVVAMYHDQGLIPVKYLGLDKGVNITLGLPFVRTSVDHGTAFDIAANYRADPSSLLAAIDMALQLS